MTPANASRRAQILLLVVLLVVTLSALAFGLSRCGSFETEAPDRFIIYERPGKLLIVDYAGNVKQTFDLSVVDASWSPDGKQIAFADQQNNLGLLNIDSSEITPLTLGTVTSNTQYLRWSPDGRHLAFISEPEREHWTVGLIQLTESPKVVLSIQCEYECRNLDWLHNGQSLIYAEGLGSHDYHLVARVRELDIKTSQVSTLFSVDHGINGMRISPDGTQLVLVAHGNGGAYSLSDLTGHEVQLPLYAGDDPCWVQDGENLAITRWAGEHTLKFDTFIYNIEWKTLRELYPPRAIFPIFEEQPPFNFMLDCR
jgi:Tol biopolymer transport system component